MENRLNQPAPLALRHWGTLVALGLILLVTLGWWALALWPLPAEAPPALLRARTICFGSADNGLPNGIGWMMLIGEPLMITLLLVSVTGGVTVQEALHGLARHAVGRVTLTATALAVVAGLTLAGARVTYALGIGPTGAAEAGAATVNRLDRPAPPLDLVDQHGATVSLASLRGKPVLLTFAYAHCQTVCPLVVGNVIRARQRLAAEAVDSAPQVVVVTLDPWRDTPARLSAMAQQWGLPDDAHVLSGSVSDVEGALTRWEVPHTRNMQNGEITHPNVVYVLDRSGRIAFATNGDAEQIAALVDRIEAVDGSR